MYWLEMSVWTRNCNKHRCSCFWGNNQINRNEPNVISMLDWTGFIFNVNLRFLQWEFYKKYPTKIFGNYRWSNSHFTCNKILILEFNNSFSNQPALFYSNNLQTTHAKHQQSLYHNVQGQQYHDHNRQQYHHSSNQP